MLVFHLRSNLQKPDYEAENMALERHNMIPYYCVATGLMCYCTKLVLSHIKIVYGLHLCTRFFYRCDVILTLVMFFLTCKIIIRSYSQCLKTVFCEILLIQESWKSLRTKCQQDVLIFVTGVITGSMEDLYVQLLISRGHNGII